MFSYDDSICLSRSNQAGDCSGVCLWKKQKQGGGASQLTAACQSEDSPERVDLTGLLHGDPGADETGDEAAGEREDRTGEDRVEGGGRRQKRGRQRGQPQFTARFLHLLFIIISWSIFNGWKSSADAQLRVTSCLVRHTYQEQPKTTPLFPGFHHDEFKCPAQNKKNRFPLV